MAKWEEAPEIDSAPSPSAQANTVPKWMSAPEIDQENEDQKDEGAATSMMNPTAETIASLASGAVAQPLSGLVGLGASLIPGVSAADAVKKVQETLTYSPKTAAAKQALSYLSYPFEKLTEGTSKLGSMIGGDFGEMTGHIVGEAAPMLLPIKGLKKGNPRVQAIRERAQAFRDAGFKIPPAMAKDTSTVGRVAGGIGGAQTLKEASLHNQELMNKLANKDLGVPEGTQLSPEILDHLEVEPAKSYDALKSLPDKFKTTDEYIDKLYGLGAEVSSLSKNFPDIASHKKIRTMISNLAKPDMTPREAMGLIRQLRADSKLNSKNYLKPKKVALGNAQGKAAGLLEDMVESNLQSMGNPELLDNFRAARKQFAKINDVRRAYNETTGDVSLRKLGAALARKAPLSEGLRTGAEFARSFENAAQTPSMTSNISTVSPGEIMSSIGLGALGGLSHGAYGSFAAAIPALRPASRALVLSDMYQRGRPRAIMGPLSAVKQTSPFLMQSAGESGQREE